MRLRDLLDAIDTAGGTIDTDTAGRLKVKLRPSALAELRPHITEHRAMLLAIVSGRRSGHVPVFCECCGQVIMTAAKTSSGGARSGVDEFGEPFDRWPTCRLTPGCGGANQHGIAFARCHPRPADLEGLRDMPAPPPQARPPARPDDRRLFGPRIPWPTRNTQ